MTTNGTATNIFDAVNPGGRIDVGTAAGSQDTLMYVYDLEPGQSSSPYHYEYDEEWLLVARGAIVVRVPDGELSLRAGDVVCFPAGPAGAHKAMNRSDEPARIVMFSVKRGLAVSVYPDSDTVGVWAGGEDDLVFQRRTAVPWAHGEEGWNRAD
jgi:uncharacterized cupin superfamily protein